ncbi:MAG TPA: DUF4179 domain-containing protein [Spirochaetia bacterium]|nr:DUF4179 domain-containing protein [Spirochaetia bacterium]
MDERIRQEIQQEANRCPVQSIPWNNIRNRVLNNTITNTSLQRNAIIRKSGYAFAVAIVICGLLVSSGFISPVMATTLERIPVIKAIFNFVGDRGIQNAIDEGLTTKVNRTATDKGISVTITDVLYDQGRLDIGYTVTTSRADLSPDDYPGDLVISLGSPGMQFLANNKPIHDTAQETNQKMGNGRVGLVEIYPRGDLPNTFNLQIVIHQIGNQQGDWILMVPVSRQYADAATKVFSPMQTEVIGQTAVVIRQIQIAPSSAVIEFSLTQPITGHFIWSNLPMYHVVDDKGHGLQNRSDYIVSSQIEGNMKTEVVRMIYQSPKTIPNYLVFITGPDDIGYPKNIKVFLK